MPNPLKAIQLATKTKPSIDPAIKALKRLNPAELELAISRLESLPQHLDISRYSPAALARISALQPAAQRGFSESLISTRPPFAASLMKPSEFLSRTEPLTAARDPEVIARLKASIGDKKLQELPALWVNQKPGGLDAAYEGRHRMQALLEMYGDDPVMMSLIKGDRFEPRVDFFGKPYEGAVDEMRLSPEEILKQKIQMGDRPLELSPLWTGYAKGGKVKDPYAAERGGPSELTKQYPKLSGFLQGLVGSAPDEMGSVLDPLTAEQRKGAEYGFPIGTALQMLPFGGGIAAAPKAVGMSQRGVVKVGGKWVNENAAEALLGRAEQATSIEELSKKYFASLPADIREILQRHSTAPVNHLLRKPNLRERAEALDQAFYNAPSLPKDVTLFRGEAENGPLRIYSDTGDRFPYYIPTSLNRKTAARFAAVSDDAGSLNLIRPQGDTQFMTAPHFAGEQEVILPRQGMLESADAPRNVDAAYTYDAKYAKGGLVSNPDQMTHKPQPKTVNPLQSVARGWAAGTAGLPGDLESLARLAAKYVSAPGSLAERWGQGDTALPTTDFYREWLPGKQTGIGEEAEGIGSLMGGFGATKLAKPIEKVGRAAIRNAMVPATLGKQAGVMKMSGGNWLKGTIEDSLRGLKQQPPVISGEIVDEVAGRPLFDAYRAHYDAGNENVGLARWLELNHPDVYNKTVGPEGTALNKFIDKQLTTYIRNDMATPGDPLRALAEKWAVDQPQQLAAAQAKIDALQAKGRQIAAERGVPEEYLTRHRQDVIAAEKEKQLIELTQGIHVNPEQLNFRVEQHGKYLEPGQTAVAQSPAAKAWEGASDLKVYNNTAGDFLEDADVWMPAQDLDNTRSQNPWLAKVPPETPVHSLAEASRLPEDLGFKHLMDELRNAVNPDSGLPPELLLKYENLPKITVPQAVERVAKINAWRAAKEVEANLAKANNAATHLHKEYPEGYKWVELKAPERTIDNIPDSFKKEYDYQLSRGFTPEQAFNEIRGDIKSPELADALKYEGDTMKHCVGGYCPDVMEGKSRIFSLRDSKGQPHVTIETQPGISAYDKWYGSQPVDSPELSEFGNFLKSNKVSGKGGLEQWYKDWRASQGQEVVTPYSIKQIKGKSNRAPNEEYLPYVQDFVKSGQWEDVGDLENSGLQRGSELLNDSLNPMFAKAKTLVLEQHPDLSISKGEMQKILSKQYYSSSEEIASDILNSLPKPPEPGFAKGGMVQPSYNRPKLVNPRAAQNRNCSCQ